MSNPWRRADRACGTSQPGARRSPLGVIGGRPRRHARDERSAIVWVQHRESQADAERTAAVRDFMFDLVNDAEASEDHEGDRDRQADARRRRGAGPSGLGAQPQLQGELLSELGRSTASGRGQSAVPAVLEESVRARGSRSDRRSSVDRVACFSPVRDETSEICRAPPRWPPRRGRLYRRMVDCRKARAYSSSVLSQLASFAGDDAAALREMRSSARDTELGFGLKHEETALAHLSLAIMRAMRSVNEAESAMRKALAAADRLSPCARRSHRDGTHSGGHRSRSRPLRCCA